MKQWKNLKFKWQMEGEKDFDEEPIEALASQLIKRGDTYKGKFKKLENAVATGKTITTTTGAKLVTIPKTSSGKTSIPVVKIPNPVPTVTKVNKASPQTSVLKFISGKKQPKRTPPKSNKGPQVSGSNQYRPSKNTRSQTKDRQKYATQAVVTSNEKIVVDTITSSSESEDADEDVNQVSNDEVSDVVKEQLTMDEDSNEEQ